MLKETNVLIGTIGLNNLQLWSKRSEIDMICILAIGEMVMLQKQTGEIINYGFKDLGLFRIGAITYPENVTSCRMLSKIGFQKEGLLRDIFIKEISNTMHYCIL